ncbi:hypothetical protein BD289DRAFT_440422 [Coniella lustricola]|uniref:Uncharacterized protein n=1 Tax=Coniella lustricola TaxID=2025994 RepID=A0A2T3A0N8_9PEZI|nr:hypothetical protein BD289DRAFT_440422 [Coniella lustricola]
MYLPKIVITTFVTASYVLAAPSVLESRAVDVGYGQQLQNSDQTNHWVVWIEGESACPATRTLSSLLTSPCNQYFTLAGERYKFVNCNGNNEPQAVKDATGSIVRSCELEHDKINCHNGIHDIVKHGKCV